MVLYRTAMCCDGDNNRIGVSTMNCDRERLKEFFSAVSSARECVRSGQLDRADNYARLMMSTVDTMPFPVGVRFERAAMEIREAIEIEYRRIASDLVSGAETMMSDLPKDKRR